MQKNVKKSDRRLSSCEAKTARRTYKTKKCPSLSATPPNHSKTERWRGCENAFQKTAVIFVRVSLSVCLIFFWKSRSRTLQMHVFNSCSWAGEDSDFLKHSVTWQVTCFWLVGIWKVGLLRPITDKARRRGLFRLFVTSWTCFFLANS